jgi:hypothetical protein
LLLELVQLPNLIDLQTDVPLLPAIKGLLRNPTTLTHTNFPTYAATCDGFSSQTIACFLFLSTAGSFRLIKLLW